MVEIMLTAVLRLVLALRLVRLPDGRFSMSDNVTGRKRVFITEIRPGK